MLTSVNFRELAIGVGNHLRAWSKNRRGNVAMLFGLMAIPLVVLLGFGIDYYKGLSDKSRLDAAADAAALAAINAAQQYISNNSQTQTDPGLTNNAIAAGQAQGLKAFYANAGTTESEMFARVTPSVTLSRQGQTFNATVNYSGQTPTSFGSIVGINVLNLSGTVTSSLTMGRYLDFYLLLDVSGSMGLPTSPGRAANPTNPLGQSDLAATNPDNAMYKTTYPTGCAFACHFSGYAGFQFTRTNGIALRVDSVGSAVQALLQTAQATMTLANQYRIGIYPFIVHAIQAAPLSSNFTAANTVGGNFANYLDQGTTNGGMGSGGTHFENLWTDLRPYLKGVGDGSGAASPQPFIFLVTDGADNNQTYTSGVWSSGGSEPQLPSTTLCSSAKAAGYTVSVLYIPYVPISPPNPSFAGNEDGKVNAIIPSIPSTLQSCASPGFFFTANSQADITSAMQAMFAQALQAARLTN